MGGWRTTPLPPHWKRTVRRICRRDPVCRIARPDRCTITSTTADHIIPASRGGTDDDTNLQGACQPCHNWKTGFEARGGTRKRPEEAHPGLVRS